LDLAFGVKEMARTKITVGIKVDVARIIVAVTAAIVALVHLILSP
jgi:hypothetical protein